MNTNDYHYSPGQSTPDIHKAGVDYDLNPGASYGDHIKNTTAICNLSATHTYGNVLSVVEKYLLDLFPKNLFKTVTASTTLASKQVNHLPHQLVKKEVPIMVLVPRIVFGQGENRFLGGTLMNSRMNNTMATWGDGSLIELANDKYNNIYVHGHYNRAVMYVDVVLSFNTYSEQMNWMNYMWNMIPIGHDQAVKAPLELYIPEGVCKLLSGLAKVPVENDKKSVYDFMAYMNSTWFHPVTYKLKGGSNTNEFFMYYVADIDMIFDEPQAGPGIKDGQIRRNFDISFTVRCDFNTIGYMTVNAPEIKQPVIMESYDDESIVPLFSDMIDLEDFRLPVGWVLLSWPIFKLGPNESSISIDSILNDSLRTVIDYHLQFNIPIQSFINIQFRENGQILNDELFYIDWHERVLHLMKPDQHRTYRLIVMVANNYVNEMIKKLYNLE